MKGRRPDGLTAPNRSAPADYPFFDRDANAITYDYWHGYAKLARDGVQPRYAFGHGLSYTRFARRALRVTAHDRTLNISVTVANIGDRAGDESILCYVGYPGQVERWPRALKAFTRLSLAPGEARTVAMTIDLDDLRYRDARTHGWRFEPGDYDIILSDGTESELRASVRL